MGAPVLGNGAQASWIAPTVTRLRWLHWALPQDASLSNRHHDDGSKSSKSLQLHGKAGSAAKFHAVQQGICHGWILQKILQKIHSSKICHFSARSSLNFNGVAGNPCNCHVSVNSSCSSFFQNVLNILKLKFVKSGRKNWWSQAEICNRFLPSWGNAPELESSRIQIRDLYFLKTKI